ncbi:MAG: protein kinase [Planctomycetia bacterium]|nr:protein kinase [Planctomycetia bacterium]
MRLQVGQRVLHFVLERKLGEGGFGEVWLAKAGMAHTALKFVSVAGEDLEKGRKEYNRIRWGIEKGLFNHDRLIKMNGVWLLNEQMEDIPDAVLESALGGRTMELKEAVVEPDTLLIQMDLGQESLASLLKRSRKDAREGELKGVPTERLLPFIWQAAEGIDFLNTPRTGYDGQPVSAVYHCDIKPENLLLMDDGKVKICDYGVARIEGKAKTRSPNALSLAHASPELVDDQPCAQSDQYSLAITYVQLRTGRLPFKPDVITGTWRTVMRAVARGDLDLNILVDPAERAVIKRATSLNPTKRYPTAMEMSEALWRAVSPETVPTGRIPRPPARSSWKFGLTAVAAVALIAFGIWFMRRDGDSPVPAPVSEDINNKRGVLRQLVQDSTDSPLEELEAFDALEDAIKSANGSFNVSDGNDLAKVLERLLVAVTSKLDASKLTDAEQNDLAASIQLAQRYASHKQLPSDSSSYVNRFRLAGARLEMHKQWPQPEATPQLTLRLFNGGDPMPSDQNWTKPELGSLAVLEALERWPSGNQTLDVKDVNALIAVMEKAKSVKNSAGAEQVRFEALWKKATSDAAALLGQNGSELSDDLKRLANLFELFNVQRLLTETMRPLKADNAAEVKEQLRELNEKAQDESQKHAIRWANSLVELFGDAARAELEVLKSGLPTATPEERAMLAEVFAKRFVSKAVNTEDLPLLALAAEIAKEFEPSLQAKLVAQRVATRLMLPENEGNSWPQWSADVELANELAKAAGAAIDGDDNWVGYLLLRLAHAELAAFAAAPTSAKIDAARTELGSIKAQELGVAEFDKQFRGYRKYVEAVLAATNRATAIADLYGGPADGIPALLWPTRRDLAASILVDGAHELRLQPVEDLSQPPFRTEDAEKANRFIRCIEQLQPGAPSPELTSLKLLLEISKPDLIPEAVIELLDSALPAQAEQDNADIAPLLIASAVAHAELHQKNSAGPGAATADAKAAVEHFARAFHIYDAWTARRPEDLARMNDRIFPSARSVLQPYVRLDNLPADTKLKSAVSQVAATLGRAYMTLSNERMLSQPNEVTSRAIADLLRVANTLSAEPQQELLKLEGAWLREMMVRGEGGVRTRLVELKKLVTGDDPESLALRGIATFVEYRQQSEWPGRKKTLEESLTLFDQAIGDSPMVTLQNARYFLDRGGVNLQLAYVQYKGKSELGASAKSVKDYLDDAISDADKVLDANQMSEQRLIEACNLKGNASEDMYFYAADVGGDRISFHHINAKSAFERANSLDSFSPDAVFNLARCIYRYGRAQRLHQGAEEFDDFKVRRALEDANVAMKEAVRLWAAAKTEKRAEALYWHGEILDELANVVQGNESIEMQGQADERFGEAAALARELGDPRWSSYQFKWARIALDQKKRDLAKSRVQEIINAYTASVEPPAGVVRKVDKSGMADAVYMLIRLQPTVKDARDVLNKYAPTFDGQSPVDLACEARIRLAFANSLISKPELHPEMESEATRVLALTEPPKNYNMREVYRSQANNLLGRASWMSIKPTDTDVRQVQQATRAADFLEAGMKDVAAQTDSDSQEIWIFNAFFYKDAAARVALKATDNATRTKYVKAFYQCLNEFDRRIDESLPGQKLNDKLKAEWKRQAAIYRDRLKEQKFPPDPGK